MSGQTFNRGNFWNAWLRTDTPLHEMNFLTLATTNVPKDCFAPHVLPAFSGSPATLHIRSMQSLTADRDDDDTVSCEPDQLLPSSGMEQSADYNEFWCLIKHLLCMLRLRYYNKFNANQ